MMTPNPFIDRHTSDIASMEKRISELESELARERQRAEAAEAVIARMDAEFPSAMKTMRKQIEYDERAQADYASRAAMQEAEKHD